ncbi:MAG: PAS domain S-box protein [Anaerolineae bacterium]|nr:PAS domain S-box protein [Anaerolineae bacterium]
MSRDESPNQPAKTTKELETISELLVSIVERVNDGFVALDKNWRYVYVNRTAAQMLNREKPEDLIGKHIWTEYPEGVGQPFYHAYYKAAETQETVYLEEYYEPWDRWFENRIYPSPDGLTIYFTEITERKRAERTRFVAEERLRLAVKAANVGLWDWDLRTNQVYFSSEWKRQIGYEDHEISNDFSEWQSRVHPEDLESALRTIQEFIAHPYPNYQNEFRFRHKDGSYRWIMAQADLLFDETGKAIRMLGSHIDVTARKQADETLRENQRQLDALMDNLPGLVYRCSNDPDWTTRFVSDGCRQLTGYAPEDFTDNAQLAFANIIHPDDRERVWAEVQDTLANDATYQITYRITTADGEVKWVWEHGTGVWNAAGELLFLEGLVLDVTERKRAEEKLHESEQRFSRIFHASPVAIALSRPADARLVDVNEAMEVLTGYSRSELLGHTSHELNLYGKPQIRQSNIQEIHRRGRFNNVELQLRRKSGEIRDVLLSSELIELGGEKTVLSMVIDITERKQIQAALQESEERLRLFIEHAPASLAMFDREMRYLAASHRWLMDYNLGECDIIGRSHYEIFPEIPDRWREVHRRGLAGEVQKVDEDDFLRADGTVQWLRWEVRPWYRADGVIGGIVIFTEDVTERKQAVEEIRQLNADLEQRVAERTVELEAKNRELETFTYSVSHDLKAPLRGIDGYSRLLLEDYLDQVDEEGRSFLQNIRIAADQMNQLIDDLLAYSRLERRPLQSERVNPQKLTQSLVAERAAEIKAREVTVTLSIPDTTVTADPNGLAMALRNLLDNALKFTKQAEKAVIEFGGREADSSCILWVRDNGIGFDMKYHDRILEMFQRLHRAEDYPGTGIGLAIVHKAMQRMGGRVWAESEAGQGATFYLEVPK